MASGKSVQLYLVDGTPGGLMIAEIVNWTGKILSCPRSNLSSILQREELLGTGVYILLGDNLENPQQPTIYIGETDEVKKRLIQHSKDKDWWNRVIAITNKDLNLTKSHVRFLEYRMISKAREAQRSKLENGNSAVLSPLPEAAQSDMEQFLEQIELILPLLNVNILRKPQTITTPKNTEPLAAQDIPESTIFEMFLPTKGVHARAQEVDGEFVVLAGSEVTARFRNKKHFYSKLREKLEMDGTIVPTANPDKYTLPRDFSFASPSAAAAMIAGRAANGRLEWKVIGTGQTYGNWQQARIETEV